MWIKTPKIFLHILPRITCNKSDFFSSLLLLRYILSVDRLTLCLASGFGFCHEIMHQLLNFQLLLYSNENAFPLFTSFSLTFYGVWQQRPHRRNFCTNRSGRHRSHQAGNIEHWVTLLDNAAYRVTKQRLDRVTTRRVFPRHPHEAQACASHCRTRLHSVSA
jgi:hypothetical protein